MRAHLDEGRVPALEQCRRVSKKRTGSRRLRTQYSASSCSPARTAAGDGGVHGQLRARRLHVRELAAAGLVAKLVHLRAVRGHVHLDRPAEHVAGREAAASTRSSARRDRPRARSTWPVADRDRERVPRGQRAASAARSTDSSTTAIAPRPAMRAEQPAAPADHARRVVERERPGHVRRRDLAHAVSDHRVGHDAPGAPQRRERDLDREQRRLHHVDLAQARALGRRSSSSSSDQPASARDRGVAALDRLAEAPARGAAACGPSRATASLGPGNTNATRPCALASGPRPRAASAALEAARASSVGRAADRGDAMVVVRAAPSRR